MSLPALMGFAAVLFLIELHTISYAVWTWKDGNKMSSVIVFLLCAVTAVLPVYIAFFST